MVLTEKQHLRFYKRTKLTKGEAHMLEEITDTTNRIAEEATTKIEVVTRIKIIIVRQGTSKQEYLSHNQENKGNINLTTMNKRNPSMNSKELKLTHSN
jgi:hypothetical protein